MKVGITGGIGSGKTTVCKLFELLGIPVYFADDRAKELMTSNRSVKEKISLLLGSNAYYKNGRLNRKYVASLVFKDKTLLNALNAIVHPAVQLDASAWFDRQTSPFAIEEAALLIESGAYKNMDIVLFVACPPPENQRITRVMQRDGLTFDEVKSRIQKQMPDSDKIKYAHYVIYNDNEQSLIKQVMEIYHVLIKRISTKN